MKQNEKDAKEDIFLPFAVNYLITGKHDACRRRKVGSSLEVIIDYTVLVPNTHTYLG